jgi:radical SAM superfamily enzyme
MFNFLAASGVRGGGKCPEEEHTTCSGGPTIYCHKRGLRGERKKRIKYSLKKRIFYNKK